MSTSFGLQAPAKSMIVKAQIKIKSHLFVSVASIARFHSAYG